MATKKPLKLSREEIQYAIEHVFLPPELPQSGDDPQIVYHEASLLAIVADALQAFSTSVQPSGKAAVDGATAAIQRFRKIVDVNGFLNEDMLRQGFDDLSKNGKSAGQRK